MIPGVLFLMLGIMGIVGVGVSRADIPKTVTLRNYFGEGFTFERPVAVVEMPGHDSVFAVVQQSGATILVRHVNGVWTKSVFDSVAVSGVNSGSSGDDGGQLGLAFHPFYAVNRKYYLYYVASTAVQPRPGRILFEERRADSTLFKRNTAVAPRLVLSLNKPYIYHNGGTLKFGKDGYLYTAIGDGGSSGDPQNRAQARDSLWGKFLRIIADGPDAYPSDSTRNYGVPADNPFIDSVGTLPEIWAYGLRSPWKWDWNPFTGDIWLGDIGQSRYEEITRVPRGGNLGWKIREGEFCYTGSTCTSAGLTPPVFTFPSRSFGQSVTGGVFFVGDSTAAFHGVYIYGDFYHNKLYALRPNLAGTGWVDTATLASSVMNLVSLDKDRRGRILAVSMASTTDITANSGAVYVLESPDLRLEPEPVRLARERAEQYAAARGKPPRLADLYADLRANSAATRRYTLTSIDGRRVDLNTRMERGTVVIIRDRERPGASFMITVLPE